MSAIRLSQRGYYEGLVAGLLASATMILAGRLWSAPVPPQLIADRLIGLVPVDVFGHLLGQFESSAKPLTFVLLIVAQVLVGGLIGSLIEPRTRDQDSLQPIFWVVFLGLTAFFGLILAPLGGIGLFGRHSTSGTWIAATAFAVEALVFAASLTAMLGSEQPRLAPSVNEDRRRAIRALALGLPAVLAVAYLGRFLFQLSSKSQVSGAARDPEGLPLELTPVDDFYVVSKNFVDPNVAPDGWSLQISGKVDHPRKIVFDELRTLPAVTQVATLECISNEVGGEYISNGRWTGTRLSDLLQAAGIQGGVVDVVLKAADGYSDSIPLTVAMDKRTILAYELNGQPLPAEHGFPLRLIVPNIYGMKNVKWITEVHLVTDNFMGYWEDKGWSDVATIQTMSRIDVPKAGSKLTAGQRTTVGGIAFAGSRGISKVQVSSDGGATWRDAAIRKPMSELSWVLWTLDWMPSMSGSVTLAVRATDGTGATQTEKSQPPLPDGATGYDTVTVRVVEPAVSS